MSRGSVRIYNVLQPRVRLRLKCDGTRAETRFRLSVKRTSPFKSAGASVQSTAGSRGVRIGDNNAGCIKFRGSVKRTGYRLHSPVSPLLPLTCATVCHHISIGLYYTLCTQLEACRCVIFIGLWLLDTSNFTWSISRKYEPYNGCNSTEINTFRTGSFKFFKRPLPGFLKILTL